MPGLDAVQTVVLRLGDGLSRDVRCHQRPQDFWGNQSTRVTLVADGQRRPQQPGEASETASETLAVGEDGGEPPAV